MLLITFDDKPFKKKMAEFETMVYIEEIRVSHWTRALQLLPL